jgi:hypothetical protein
LFSQLISIVGYTQLGSSDEPDRIINMSGIRSTLLTTQARQ